MGQMVRDQQIARIRKLFAKEDQPAVIQFLLEQMTEDQLADVEKHLPAALAGYDIE